MKRIVLTGYSCATPAADAMTNAAVAIILTVVRDRFDILLLRCDRY
jgi:hypothetical protein